jgi:hypothetical protein
MVLEVMAASVIAPALMASLLKFSNSFWILPSIENSSNPFCE